MLSIIAKTKRSIKYLVLLVFFLGVYTFDWNQSAWKFKNFRTKSQQMLPGRKLWELNSVEKNSLVGEQDHLKPTFSQVTQNRDETWASFADQFQVSPLVKLAISKLDFKNCVGHSSKTDDPILKLDATDCVLFCASRNYKRINIRVDDEATCFCSNLTERKAVGCKSDRSYRSYDVEKFPKILVQNESYVGCLLSEFKSGSDSNWTTSRIASGSVVQSRFQNSTGEELCVNTCNDEKKPVALTTIKSSDEQMCSCSSNMISAFQSIETVTQMGCSQRIHVTPSAYSVCKKADFLTEDGRKGTKEGKKVPRVGVVSVPGAGSHWIRTLFQKMSGIYSGSCYYAQESRKYGLMGEFKPWQSNTTTFIKSHEIEDPFISSLEKIIVLTRNPLRSSLAQFARSRVKIMNAPASARAFTSKDHFLEVSGRENQFKGQFDSILKSQTERTIKLTEYGKPMLIISYEDLMENLHLQLLRIAHFLELDNDATVWERSFCAVLDANSNTGKRQQKVDLGEEALNLINRTSAYNILDDFDKKLRMIKLHYLRPQDYPA